SPLLADFDNDGFTDLFITNGIYRRPNDMDYLKYISDEKVKRSLNVGITEENLKVVLEMPEVKISNYAFKNNGNLGFENTSDEWGFETDPGYSNGAVYADLDNDGDLDLVINNLDEKSGIYRNNQETANKNNYLKIKGVGKGKNTFGIGMQVQVFHQGKQWVQELYPTRGFQSSMGHELSFGLGEIQSPLDSVKIKWASGKTQTLKKIAVNQLLVVDEKNAAEPEFAYKLEKYEPLFSKVNPNEKNLFVHRENGFTDFNNERLIPHKLSTEGPSLAVGDVNNDGLEDFYIGGARNQSGQLFIQNSDDEFDRQLPANLKLWENEKHYEDVAAEFFDADNDGDLDLFIGSGGYDLSINNARYSDRLYLNNGSGEFEKSIAVMPELNNNTSCATAVDFDLDGDIDLFVGTRAIVGNYGLNPDSYLLENDGFGKFNEVDSYGIFKGLGMVTDAIWTDINEDAYPDLVVVGEWMPITIFENSMGVFMKAKAISNTEGWWNTIESADLDGDGDQDFVAGNLGLNSALRGTIDQPMQLYIKDFDQNSANDPILSIYRKNKAGDFKEYPFDGRDKLIGQMPQIRKKFVDYKAISGKTIQEIFSKKELSNAVKQKAVMMESAVIENMGNGKFQIKSLPKDAQFSPINSISIQDFNGDGHFDILTGGNLFGVTPSIGQFDASMSQLFIGDGKGIFKFLPNTKTGMWIDGEIKKIHPILNANGEVLMLIAINNGGLKFYKSKVIHKKIF
ncbi:MAG: VCBS repeat-containing protein, partial [Flammeovirgaceae bacterium]|nr:VCBS repeat-containing protein [Flammeovirgaceae bacterium]